MLLAEPDENNPEPRTHYLVAIGCLQWINIKHTDINKTNTHLVQRKAVDLRNCLTSFL